MKKRTLKCFLSVLLLGAIGVRAAVTVNEACYKGSTLQDEFGNTPDWVELYNSGPAAVNLNGWYLTDNGEGATWPANPKSNPADCILPNYTLAPGAFFVVFCETGTTGVTWTNAPDFAAIPENVMWRYTVSDPGGTWKTLAYNDDAWLSGMVPIGHDAARAHLDCAKALPSLPQTLYLRRKFTLPLVSSSVTGLLVRVRASDGFALHLNGTEIQRVNLPGGALTHSTAASSDQPTTAWFEAVLPTSVLQFGLAENVLAAQVHRATGGVDMVFDLALTALVDEAYPIVHLGFSLGDGEKIYLYNAAGTRVLKFNDNNTVVPSGKSLGQPNDGDIKEKKEVIYDYPSPGMPNASTFRKYLETLAGEKPTFSVAPGSYATSQNVRLSTATTGHKVYYTLDGSDPWFSETFVNSGASITLNAAPAASGGLAWIRTNPLETGDRVAGSAWQAPLGTVPRAVVLRAIAVDSTGRNCSAETSGTYFIGAAFANRTLPAVSITTEALNLFGFTQGLYVPGKMYADSPEGYGSNRWGKPYANYHQTNSKQEWERPAYLEFFEAGQSAAAFELLMGVAMHGGGSRAIPQKTLYMLSRKGEYGTDTISYQLFPDEPATVYKRFLLRNNGNDWYGPQTSGITTMMKDGVIHRLSRDLDLAIMAYRPVTVHINGDYWGIHNLRESLDKHYLATRYGLDPDSVDILTHEEDSDAKDKVKISRIEGDKSAKDDYEDLLDWIKDNSLISSANYQQLHTWVDVTNHADYIITETFFANTDWPINNCDFWRAHTNQTATSGRYGDTRWRWMLYDLDVAGEEGAGFNMFNYLSSSKMTGKSEPGFLINQLWQNQEFRNLFVTRYANLLNTAFNPVRMATVIAQAADDLEPEIERHLRRWGRSFTQAQWRQAVETSLIDFTAARHTNSWTHLSEMFFLGGTGALAVRNQDTGGVGGGFTVNGVAIESSTPGVASRAAWSGTFFRSLAVPVRATADSGYVFDGWVGTASINPEPLLFVGDEPITLTARFRPAGAPAYQPTPYESWASDNFSEQELLGSGAARPEAPSGLGSYSNYELFALGVSRYAGLTPEQVAARTAIGIRRHDDGLWLDHFQTPAPYTLLSATSLVDAVWLPYPVAQTITNPVLERIEHKAHPAESSRFFKWRVAQPQP